MNAWELLPPEAVALTEALPDGWAITNETPDGRARGICIESTRFVTTALRRFGIECKPMACDVLAMNAQAAVLYEQGVPVAEWPDDAWSLGITVDAPKVAPKIDHRSKDDGRYAGQSITEPYRKKGWHGHVVVHGDGWWLDLTAEQLHRPDKGIEVPGALCGPLIDDRGVEVILGGGPEYVQYRWRPEVKGYRTTPAWRQDVPRDLLDLVEKRVKETMK